MELRSAALRIRPALVLGIVAMMLAVAVLAYLRAGTGLASSHREAPLIAGLPRLDNTDVYAFVSPDQPDTVTLIANFIPFEEPNGGPNFYTWDPNGRYNIKIDNNGDAKPDVTYSWVFTDDDRRDNTFLYNNGPIESLDDENLLYRQTYDLTRTTEHGEEVVVHGGISAPSNVGPASVPDYSVLRQQAVYDTSNGGKAYAGQSAEAFALDLRVFDLLYGGDLSEIGQNTTNGYNVNTLAIQVPMSDLALNGDPARNPVIGIWSTADAWSPDGYQQVSRLGNPLVNEVVVPAKLKDQFNRTPPEQDADLQPIVDRVTNPEVPQLLEAIYGIMAPQTPRNDLVEIFLTGIATGNDLPIEADLNSLSLNADVDQIRPAEYLRLNMSVPVTAEPNRLGVLGGDLQGFPNGRRLDDKDDVVDIELQALVGAAQTGQLVGALAAGDMVDGPDVPTTDTFPYTPLPNNQSVNTAGPGGSGS